MTAVLPPLPATRARVLDAIRRHIRVHGWPPTIREIQAAVGLQSPSAALYQLRELERAGLIRRGNSPRAIALTQPEETP